MSQHGWPCCSYKDGGVHGCLCSQPSPHAHSNCLRNLLSADASVTQELCGAAGTQCALAPYAHNSRRACDKTMLSWETWPQSVSAGCKATPRRQADRVGACRVYDKAALDAWGLAGT